MAPWRWSTGGRSPFPGTEAVRQGAKTVEVEIGITRIYAMKPKMG